MAVDVIFGEIVREYFETVAREMNTTMDNTSVSPVFSETHDCSAGLFYYDGQDVSLVARANAEPVHIFASVHSVEGLLRYYKNDLAEGDIVMVDDPYVFGGRHSDWTVVKPVFYNNKPVFFPGFAPTWSRSAVLRPAGTTQTRATSGRRGSGSRRSSCSSAGRCVATISTCCGPTTASRTSWRAISTRCSARVGWRSVGYASWSTSTGSIRCGTAVQYILDYSERRLRAELAKWPDGDYSGRSVLDFDFADTRDVNVDSRSTFEAIRSTSTSRARTRRPRASSTADRATRGRGSTARSARCFDDIPINSGFFSPWADDARGTVINPLSPAPVGNSTICIGNDIGQSVIKALEDIVPERVGAATLDLVATRSTVSTRGGPSRSST